MCGLSSLYFYLEDSKQAVKVKCGKISMSPVKAVPAKSLLHLWQCSIPLIPYLALLWSEKRTWKAKEKKEVFLPLSKMRQCKT